MFMKHYLTQLNHVGHGKMRHTARAQVVHVRVVGVERTNSE